MKKILAILALAVTSSAFAADFVSIDVDNVNGRKGAGDSTAQYVRAGKDIGNYSLGLQSRNAKNKDGSGTFSSVEATVANKNVSIAGITPFVGVGHDNGFNGGAGYNYGLVGATYGRPVGPGFLLLGAKTRVGSTENTSTKQTVSFATYSVPVAKQVALNFNVSRSSQDIKEKAFGLGLSFFY